jgi:hypothetical protein
MFLTKTEFLSAYRKTVEEMSFYPEALPRFKLEETEEDISLVATNSPAGSPQAEARHPV